MKMIDARDHRRIEHKNDDRSVAMIALLSNPSLD